MAYNVLVVDDQKISRQLFENIIESSDNYTLVASIESARVADTYCARFHVDLILMDIVMRDSYSGLDAAEHIRQVWPKTRIIVMTSMADAAFLKKAREIGVDSFWYKEVQRTPMLEVMDKTMAGESVWPLQAPVVSLGLTSSTDITERELDVLRELVCGSSDQEIAEDLCISYHTVRSHLKSLLAKTGFSSRTELALKAIKSGIVVPYK